MFVWMVFGRMDYKIKAPFIVKSENVRYVPAPVEGYFDPVRHLTGIGKIYFDQAIIAASDCAQLCLDGLTNPHIMYYRPKTE